jgi:hypothetical protein
MYREAMAINRGIEKTIHEKLVGAAFTKLAADTTLTVLGFLPTGKVASVMTEVLKRNAVQLVYSGASYHVQTQLAGDAAQASASKQLIVGVAQNAADVGAEASNLISKEFASSAGTYDAEARAIVAKLRQANLSTSERLAQTLTLDRKVGLTSENMAKANNWKFGGVVLKVGSYALAGYALYLSAEDFKSAVGN